MRPGVRRTAQAGFGSKLRLNGAGDTRKMRQFGSSHRADGGCRGQCGRSAEHMGTSPCLAGDSALAIDLRLNRAGHADDVIRLGLRGIPSAAKVRECGLHHRLEQAQVPRTLAHNVRLRGQCCVQLGGVQSGFDGH